MKFAVLDFETTGGNTTDEIIQIGLVIIDGFEIIERYSSLVKPSVPIPEFITELTGIDDEMVKDAPELDEVMSEVVPLIYDSALVAHHVAFDFGFLQRALEFSGYMPFTGRVLDTMDALRVLFPSLSSLNLGMVCTALDIPHDRPHQADSDAEATALIWIRCMEKLLELPLLTVQRLGVIFDGGSTDFGWFINEMREHKELHTPVDVETARYYRQFAIGVDDWGDDKDIRDEGDLEHLHVSFEEFYSELKQNLQSKFEVYETRDAQEQMIQAVENSFEDSKHLMVEAGTGTGKSLGYLIPSIYYGLKNDRKVVVSTHTINLQEQLRERDIPLLHDIFPVPFRAAVMKGRSHYLCLRKFEQKINLEDFDSGKDDRITAGQMLVWLSDTQHGDEEELHFNNKGASFWHTVQSDTESCLNRSCPWFKKCFYHRAKNDANVADIVITNHSMLFTDTKAENRLLPSYQHLVIDEAHHFEEVASKHLGMELYYGGLVSTLTWMFKDSKIGQLPQLRYKLEDLATDQGAQWRYDIEAMYPKIVTIKEDWDGLCEQLFALLTMKSDPSQSEIGQYVLRVKKDALPAAWPILTEVSDRILLGLNDILKTLNKIMNGIKELDDELDVQSVLTDLSGSVKQLDRHKESLRFFMTMPDDDYVYWLEANPYGKSKSVLLTSVPGDVSGMLQQLFFDVKESVVMTSATLSVDKSFQYASEQLGLDREKDTKKLRTLQLPSPFKYREQALVCIPRDFPGIKGPQGEAHFIDKLVESLAEVAIETRGRMLVLFTSNRMLKLTYNGLKEALKSAGIGVLGQGVDSGNRSKLTRLFQSTPSSVLLGTSSFWEGVDIPGEALSCLAIVRLPFQPPNHPLVEAKSENLKKMNMNPFMKLSVPQAVIRFKQGFGRLVRTAKDKGIVIIYDTRVLETYYGRYFLYSLPGPKIEHMTTSGLVPRIRDWMGEKRVEASENI